MSEQQEDMFEGKASEEVDTRPIPECLRHTDTDETSLPSVLEVTEEKPTEETEEDSLQAEMEALLSRGAMKPGEMRFGITCTGEPIGTSHWLADSSTCGDMVMALPSSVLVAGRTKEAKGVAIDMQIFLDSVVEGAGRLLGIEGISEASTLPMWAVSRMLGTFPALMAVYHEAMDQQALTVEAAAYKAAIGMKVTNTRNVKKKRGEVVYEETNETLDKQVAPDAALSKMILVSRMKTRYKDDGDVKQAVQINIMGAEADL